MCWVAVERGARLAMLRGEKARAEQWLSDAQVIHDDICANAVGPRGCFTQSYGSDELDASLLVLPMLGFLPPDDERIRSTIFAIADDLTDGPFVLSLIHI